MAGPVAMLDSLSQYGLVTPRYGSAGVTPRTGSPTSTGATGTAPDAGPNAAPDWSLAPSVGSGPFRAAANVLAWKGITCDDWNGLTPDQKSGVCAQYYNQFGFTADATVLRAFYAAVDAYCASACGTSPAGQADSTDNTGEVVDPGVDAYLRQNLGGGTSGTTDGTSATDYGNPDVSSSLPGKDTSGGNTSSISPALYTAVGSALGQGAAAIANIVNSNNQVAIAQLQAQTQQRIAALTAANAQATAQQRAANQSQISSLAQLLPYLSPPRSGLSTGAMFAIGVGVVAVVGGIAFVATRPAEPRRNPVVRVGPKHKKRFVSAAHLRKLRHRR